MPSERRPQSTNAGIVTDKGGERFIPESQRADGSTRKAIKIRPGFRPSEDVELYRSRGVESRNRPRGIPGAAEPETSEASAASNKNAKRREARKKAKAVGENDEPAEVEAGTANKNDGTDKKKNEAETPSTEEVDLEVEKAKKARALKKKLRQARELQNKKEDGEALLPEQIAKVIKINELVRELEALGFDGDEESKEKTPATSEGKERDTPATTEGKKS